MAQVLSAREKRHIRIRKKVFGTTERPRLAVCRSLSNVTIQLINDVESKTLCSFSTLTEEFRKKNGYGGNVKAAKALGTLCGEALKKQGIEKIVFDRGGYPYHGRVKALADAIRECGIQF
jgi:large subunit ribosomal protein L18